SVTALLSAAAFSWHSLSTSHLHFFFQAEDGIRDSSVTGVQTCALPIFPQEFELGAGVLRGEVYFALLPASLSRVCTGQSPVAALFLSSCRRGKKKGPGTTRPDCPP